MQNNFLKNFLTYFSASILVSVINYAFYPIIGRLLTIQEFGELQVLIALVAQVGLILGALSTVVTHITASSESAQQAQQKVTALRTATLLLTVPVLLLGLFTIPIMQNYLHYYEWLPFFALFGIIFISIIATFNIATLQGQNRFKEFSLNGIIQASVKLIAAITLIVLGFGVFGGVLSLLIASTVGYVYTIRYIGKWGNVQFKSLQEFKHVLVVLSPELRYGALSLVSLTSISILFTVDVLMIKHYFDAHTAGLYIGISTIAKIAYFALMPMGAVLLPSVAASERVESDRVISDESKVESRASIVKTAGFILGVMTISGVTLTYFAHELITSILFGERFVPMSHLLPSLTLAMALLAILHNITMYGLALRAKVLMYILPIGAAVVLTLNILQHSTLYNIINNLLIGIIVAISLLLLVYIKESILPKSVAK